MIGDFLGELDRVVTSEGTEGAVWDLCVAHFAQHGFDKVIYLHQSGQDVHVASSLEPAWRETYLTRGDARIDPFLSICCTTYHAIDTGIDHLQQHDILSSPQRSLIMEAADYGIRSGFSAVTQLRGAHGAAGWNLCSSLGAREVAALRRDRQDALRLAALHAHHALVQVRKLPAVRTLSRREADCLALVARGDRSKGIARKLALSPVTVDLYLRNAREKLGAATREQAVAIAIAQGQIKI